MVAPCTLLTKSDCAAVVSPKKAVSATAPETTSGAVTALNAVSA